MTIAPTLCLECNVPLSPAETQGLCARCLLKMGLASQFGESSVADAGARKFVPPPMFPFDFGGFRVLRLLGRGGMGAVYEAEQRETGRRVALKVLGHTIDSPEMRKRFLREGRLAASVNHPNSVYIFGTEEIEGAPVIAMELVAGGTLRDRIRNGPMPAREAVDAILQIIAGLEAAASAGVLHRDVKPANCFVAPDGTAKVGDFGLSVSTLVRHDSQLTASGVMLGTPSYAPPEQLRGEELDLRADIYSVGATLYALLTGRAPFEGDNAVQVVAAVLDKPAPPIPNIPRGLAQIVARCLAKKRNERFANYAALRDALLPFSGSVPEPAPLGLRLIGGVIDSFVFGLPTWMFMALTGEEIVNHWLADRTWTADGLMFGYFAFFMGYFALLEGRWGASVGKALCGLRVAGVGSGSPGIPRATLRALVYSLAWFVPCLFPLFTTTGSEFKQMAEHGQSPLYGWAIQLAYAGLLIATFATMRRRNRFAALHDLASATRVVLRPKANARPRLEVTTLPAPLMTGERQGPYLLGKVIADGAFRAGYDEVLRRRVWIRSSAMGAATLGEARRTLSRATRLRWIGGERSERANWDAFEAPPGQPLLAIAPASQPWAAVRHWLQDLAAEIDAAAKDGTLPEQLGVDQVWLTVDGRAVLLDEPWPASERQPSFHCAEPAGGQHFLHAAADAALDRSMLPLHARDFLAKLGAAAFDRVSFVLGNLQSLLAKPATVSRRRRFAALALIPGCALFLSLMMGMMVLAIFERQQAKIAGPPEGQWHALSNALMFYAALRGETTNNLTLFAPKWTKTPAMMKDSQVYLIGHFGKLIQSPTFDRDAEAAGLTAQQRGHARGALAAQPEVSSARLQEADAKFLPAMHTMERFSKILRPLVGLVIFAGSLLFIGMGSLLGAVIFGVAPLLHGFGLAVVNRAGLPASRLRLLARSALAWGPLVGGYAVLFIPTLQHALAARGALAMAGLVLMALSALGFLIGVPWTLACPTSGPHDRLSGTRVVAR